MAGGNGQGDEQPSGQGLGRRELLRGAAVAGAAGIAATAVAATGGKDLHEPVEEQVKSRYRETEHVKRFYFLNRL